MLYSPGSGGLLAAGVRRQRIAAWPAGLVVKKSQSMSRLLQLERIDIAGRWMVVNAHDTLWMSGFSGSAWWNE